MTGSEQLFGDPQSIGRRLKDAVREATGGLTASVGLSATKYVAKVASACRKPDGLTVVPPDGAKAWLAALSVSWLWGAGPKTQARLHQIGLHTIGEVAEADPDFLFAKLGKGRPSLPRSCQRGGLATRHWRAIFEDHGSERTLEKDVSEKSLINFHLRRSADVIGRRLRQKRYVASGVGIKLKTENFQTLTRQRRLTESTDVTERLYSVGVDLLKELNHRGPFRRVGMVAYDLVGIDDRVQLNLFSTSAPERRLAVAIDELVERFGPDVVHRANDLAQTPGMRLAPTLDFLDDRTRG